MAAADVQFVIVGAPSEQFFVRPVSLTRSSTPAPFAIVLVPRPVVLFEWRRNQCTPNVQNPAARRRRVTRGRMSSPSFRDEAPRGTKSEERLVVQKCAVQFLFRELVPVDHLVLQNHRILFSAVVVSGEGQRSPRLTRLYCTLALLAS